MQIFAEINQNLAMAATTPAQAAAANAALVPLIASLRADGHAIVLVEHVMDAIRALCDRCVVMNAGGKIAEGTPQAVLAEREVIAAYLGEPDA